MRAPLSPEARRAPPLCLTGDGSRTVKTRSVPIVSQATPLSLCLAASNAHPMLHQIFSSLPSFATGLFPRASACPPWGRACVRNINAERHQQNERSQSFRTRRTRQNRRYEARHKQEKGKKKKKKKKGGKQSRMGQDARATYQKTRNARP